MAGPVTNSSLLLSTSHPGLRRSTSLTLPTALSSKYFYPHFTDEETSALVRCAQLAAANLEGRPIWRPAPCTVGPARCRLSCALSCAVQLGTSSADWRSFLTLAFLLCPQSPNSSVLHVYIPYPSGVLLWQITYLSWCVFPCDDYQVTRPRLPLKQYPYYPIREVQKGPLSTLPFILPFMFCSFTVPFGSWWYILWNKCAFGKSSFSLFFKIFTLYLNKQCAHGVRCMQDTAGVLCSQFLGLQCCFQVWKCVRKKTTLR